MSTFDLVLIFAWHRYHRHACRQGKAHAKIRTATKSQSHDLNNQSIASHFQHEICWCIDLPPLDGSYMTCPPKNPSRGPGNQSEIRLLESSFEHKVPSVSHRWRQTINRYRNEATGKAGGHGRRWLAASVEAPPLCCHRGRCVLDSLGILFRFEWQPPEAVSLNWAAWECGAQSCRHSGPSKPENWKKVVGALLTGEVCWDCCSPGQTVMKISVCVEWSVCCSLGAVCPNIRETSWRHLWTQSNLVLVTFHFRWSLNRLNISLRSLTKMTSFNTWIITLLWCTCLLAQVS